MSIKIIPYEDEHIQEVKEFNTRLTDGEAGFVFPEVSKSTEFPPTPGSPIEQPYFLARESETGKIHGGFILKSSSIWKLGTEMTIGNYQLPLSEGIVNPQYGMIGVQLYLDAIRKQNKLYSLGMGSIERPLPKFLQKMGWKVEGIPFYFKILNPSKVIKNLDAIRNNSKIKPVLFFLDELKFFTIGIHLLNLINKIRAPKFENLSFTIEENFGDWADDIWNASRNYYQWIGKRNSSMLNIYYPKDSNRFIRLHIKKDSKSIGWALVLATQMQYHKQFPNLKLGTIADNLAIPGLENEVLKIAEEFLKTRKVDLIVTNQSHSTWCSGLKKIGFIPGPTNYISAFSPEMWKGIVSYSECHINRGDGDGPINL